MKYTKKRNTYLVNNRLQLTILLYGIVLALSGNVIVTLYEVLTSGRFQFFSPEGMYAFSTVLAFLLSLLLVILGLAVSNRIAGPIHNLKKHMDSVLEDKNSSPLKFRKDDYFVEIVEPYNALVEKLKK